ncbi:M48 family metalloprotease [Hydrogenophaga sp. 5NK40-0174]|uniref:M48 family metalloprotease n=1 Tax=Hydrogenophaga sp. 5NK40-0174 TaxID=3127649 RepID=UPI00333E9E17
MFERQREARGRSRRLLLAFALAVVALVVMVNAAALLAWGVVWGFWAPGGFAIPGYFFETTTTLVLLYVLGGWWLETSRLASGGAIALSERLGARRLNASTDFDERRFENIVDEMAVASGMRRPTPMLLARDQSINAFAAGWDENDAVVAVTRGALDYLTREELQGMVAHEFSHIVEGDTRMNMRLLGMVWGIELIYRGGQSLYDPDWSERTLVGMVLGRILMAVGWLGWLVGHALQAAVSRQLEFLADARSVQWTRSREAMGGVLRKVAGLREMHIESLTMAPAVQHMLLIGTEGRISDRWLDSHPPLEKRIKRIYGRNMPPIRPQRVDERTVFA